LTTRADVKRVLEDYQGALEDLDKVHVLHPNNAFTLSSRGHAKKKLKDYQGALEDLDKAHVFNPNDAFILITRGDVKRALKDYEGALEDLDKAHVLDPNNAFILTIRGNVKRALKDYEGALEDLNKAHLFDPNNVFNLITQAHVNWSLNNYDVALKTLDEANVFQPNDHIILQTRKWLKWILDKYQPIIKSLQCKSNIRAFTYNELEFQNCLGKGLFGVVYKSKWKNIEIAIKVLIQSGSHNEGAQKSFISEVLTLGSIQHTNLVRLLGYCIEGSKHVLVYEYMSNSSLDKCLLNENLLDWDKRICIIIGIAQGLAYLHHECNPTIVHLDINPQNILLDKNYTPKLGDFGLAKILDGSNENMVCAHDHFEKILLNMFIFNENVNLVILNSHVS
jgi:regulator of sirC expression with transglutaminase-like and TPR domain